MSYISHLLDGVFVRLWESNKLLQKVKMQTYARVGIFYQPGLHRLMLSSQVKSRLLFFSLSCFSWKEGIRFKTTLINILLNCMGYFEMWVGYKDLTWFQAWQWRREGRQGQRWGRKGSKSPKLSGQSRQRALPVKMLLKWFLLFLVLLMGGHWSAGHL